MAKARERERSAWVDGFVTDVLETAEELDSISEGPISNDGSSWTNTSHFGFDARKYEASGLSRDATPVGFAVAATEAQQRPQQTEASPQLLPARHSPRGYMMPQPHRSLGGAFEAPYSRNPPPSAGRKALQTRFDDGETPDAPIELTDLQRLISEGITMKGSYGTLDEIYAHVAKVCFTFYGNSLTLKLIHPDQTFLHIKCLVLE